MKNYKLILNIVIALMLIGVISYIIQLTTGLVVTDMNNSYSWGLYIAGFAFFVGNAAGGMVLSASIYMFGLKALKPFAKIGALAAFANVIGAMLCVVIDIGQPFRLLNMLIYPNFSSPLIWDVIILSSYAVLSLLYFYVLRFPEIAPEKRILFKDVENAEEFSEKTAKTLAPIALLFAIGIHVVTAWIFATQGAREWWHSAVLAPDFVAVAVSAGTTLVFLFSIMVYGIKEEHKSAYKIMTRFISIAFFVHLFFMYNDFFIHAWYGNEHALHTLAVTLGDYWFVHLLEVVLPLMGILCLMKSKILTKAKVYRASFFILIGVLAHRFLIMPAAFNNLPLTISPMGQQNGNWEYPLASGRFMEGAELFITNHNYVPTFIEWSILIGVISTMTFVVVKWHKLAINK